MEKGAEIGIIPLSISHLGAVMKIERAVFRDAWTTGAFLEVLGFSDKCWAAFADEELVGYLVTRWVLDEVHVLNLAVAPHAQREGVATRLMDFLLALSRKRGMRHLYLEVRVSNSGAIAFYEGLGFRELAVRARYYPNGEDARVMYLHLPEAAAEEPGPDQRMKTPMKGKDGQDGYGMV